jgi:acetolactate synthase-1/2/3 large subunit
MATTAEAFAAFLVSRGVRRIFGVPGASSSLEVIEACRRRHIDFVLTHRGEAAALMAATDGDLLARPGVCLSGLGPGALSLVRGAAHAFLDRAPLLLLTERASRSHLHLSLHQTLDHLQLFEAVTKMGATLTAPRAERLFARAWEEALEAPAGPVHLDLPADEAGKMLRGRGHPVRSRRPSAPSPSAIRTAARFLSRRGRIVTIAGLGSRGPREARALQDLVEHLGCPILSTPKAKGVVPEDHPLAAGIFAGGRLEEEELLAKADGVLAVGLDPVELLPRHWRASLPVVSLMGYRCGPAPYEAAAEVVADLPMSLEAFRQALPPGGGWGLAEWATRGASFKARARRLLTEASQGRGGGGIAPHRVVEIAREAFPRTTLLSVDSGIHASVAAIFWETYEPKGYLCSGGLDTMGYALPAALAAKLARPDRPVLALLGDGGFALSLPDILTAARLRLGITAVVFVDEWLGVTRALQERRRFAPTGAFLGGLNLPGLAESFGVLGTAVEDEEALRSALKDAVGTSQPAIIAARVRAGGYRKLLEILRGRMQG